MSDDAATTTGPTWTFRTTAGALPDVHLASPNGAESLAVGSPVEVRWSASDPHGVHEVDLLLSRSGIGGPWEIVAEHLSNTGSFTWTAGGSATSNAYFKVVAMDGEGDVGRDASDSPFSILAPAGAPVGSAEFALRPVAPNPTRGGARVVFELLVEADARVEILDVQGRLVAKMADGRFGPGRYERIWPGAGERRARSGLYFVRMSVAGREFTRRFLLLP